MPHCKQMTCAAEFHRERLAQQNWDCCRILQDAAESAAVSNTQVTLQFLGVPEGAGAAAEELLQAGAQQALDLLLLVGALVQVPPHGRLAPLADVAAVAAAAAAAAFAAAAASAVAAVCLADDGLQILQRLQLQRLRL